ncbi:MAG: hypothetical protein MJ169_06100 [Treponema sp.]|nr:hypothetical protein [Treponema sp.]
MTKITNWKIIAAASVVLAFFASCQSAKKVAEPVKQESTYVVTKADDRGEIYTSCVFRKIEKIEARVVGKVEPVEISPSSAKYDSALTKLVITKLPSKFDGFKADDIVYTITGIPYYPAVFVLQNCDVKHIRPGIFVEGKLAVEGKDYTFDDKLNRLEFLIDVDADKSSYVLCWLLKNGSMNTMSNFTERYSGEYTKLKKDWIRKTGAVFVN